MSSHYMVAVKYARALLQLAQERSDPERIEQELTLLADWFGQGPGKDLVEDPRLSLAEKQTRVRKLLQDKVGELTVTFFELLLEKHRGELVHQIALAYNQQLRTLRGERVATLTVPEPLSEVQLTQIREKLTALTGDQVELHQLVDPSLRGGACLRVDDLVLDGSLSSRLNRLRRVLLGESGPSN